MYLAHRAEDGREQSILEHARNVAGLAAGFAAPFGAEKPAELAGLFHDIGKYSQAFQRRIRGCDIRVDHSTAGAKEIVKYAPYLLAYCVAGHHGGLPDGGDFSGELQPRDARFRPPKVLGRGGFTAAFWTRMLFSCLVDADYLDTESFMRGSPPPRGSDVTMEQLLGRLERYVAGWWDAKSELNRVRCDILRACLEGERPGLPACLL